MPYFFSVTEVLDFHMEQIDLYGGSHGVRDMRLLESAVAMPMSGFGDSYLHAFPFEMAAAYLFHIVQDHPFVDGNKRTGLATCLYFLELHEMEIEVDPDELEQFVRSVATGQVLKPEIASFLGKYSRPLSKPMSTT
jgi:death-on-curing protein